MYQERLKAKDY